MVGNADSFVGLSLQVDFVPFPKPEANFDSGHGVFPLPSDLVVHIASVHV